MKKFLTGLVTLLATCSAFAANAPVIYGPGNSAQFLVPALMPPDAVTPPNPPANYHKMYIKPDHNLYILDSSGTEVVVGSGGTGGTVTSVGLALPAGVFSISGSPVIGTGTLTGAFINQTANRVFAGPAAGGAAAPTFRAMVPLDIPALDFSKITTGVVPIAQGGTGQATAVAGFDALSPTTTKGDIIVHNGTDNIRIPVGADTFVLTADAAQPSGVKWAAGGGGGGSGTVTSVDLAAPAEFTVSGNPITTAGTITLGKANQNQNLIYSGPAAGAAAAPTFRALVPLDIPALDFAKITTGIVPIAQGGTGQATATAGFDALAPTTTKGDLIAHDGTDNVRRAVGADGQMLVADSAQASGLNWATPNVGTVTSVDLAVPGIFTLAGNPITTAGTITVGLNTQAQNLIWSGPAAGAAATPTFRALVPLDIPALDFSKITTGIVPVAQGGTGQDFSADTGLVKVAAGTMSVATLVDADVDAAAAISFSKLAAGSNHSFAGFDATGVLYSLPGWGVEATNGNIGPSVFRPITIPADTVPTLQKMNNYEWEYDAANPSTLYDPITFFYNSHFDRTGSGNNVNSITHSQSNSSHEGTGVVGNFIHDTQSLNLGVGAAGTASNATFQQKGVNVGAGFSVPGTLSFDNFGGSLNATSVVNNLQIKNWNYAGNIGGNLTGDQIDYSGDVGGNATMLRRQYNGNATGDVVLSQLGSNGNGVNYRGVTINSAGTFTTAAGLDVNLGSIVLPGGASPIGLNINGGTLNVNASTPIEVAAGFQLAHLVFTNSTIANGSPVTATDYIAFGPVGSLTADDDMAVGPAGFGWSSLGFIANLAVTAGHTVDKASMALAGASFPVSSTGGTITEANLYDAFGFFSQGGTLNFGTVNGYKGEASMCSGAAACFGVNILDPLAANYFAGSVKSATSLILEDPGAGTNSVTIQAPAALAAPYTLTLPVDDGVGGEVLSTDGSGNLSWVATGGTGTVTSVDLAVPTEFSVSGNPITGAGTITIAKVNQNQNLIYSGPAAGAAAAPTFRALVPLDIPALDFAKITTGIVPIAQGGTGQATAVAGFNALSPLTTKGDVLTHDGTNNIRLPVGTDGFVLSANSAQASGLEWIAAGGTGTVTSVAMTVPGFLSVAGSPVTTTGTLAVTLATQTANTVFAGPAAAGPSAPTFRALVAADIPAISLTAGVSGVLPIANGGTNGATAVAGFDNLAPTTTKGDLIAHNGTDNVRVAVGADGLFLMADSAAASGVSWQAGGGGSAAAAETYILSGGLSLMQDIDGLRRAESNLTITKIVVCARERGSSGNSTIQVNYGPALASNVTLNLPGSGGPGCASSTPAIAISTNDLMNVDLISVASGAPEDLSVKLIF